MTDQQRQWFNEFAATKRQEIQGIDRGGDNRIWKFISDHYSDKAHFLYELIQNADDAGATEATFELYSDAVDTPGRDRLVFRHNGTKHFTITGPAPTDGSEYEEARRNGRLNSVYSICTVGNSTKDTNDIGKFGIGFKSVFLYTDSPRIYDEDDVRFEITDFVVPRLLEEEDFTGRNVGETVFEIPFNRTRGDHLPEDPCADILGKLRTLILPTLFLRHLEKVSWFFGPMSGYYSTTRECLFDANDGTNSHIYEALAEWKDGDEVSLDEFVLVDRPLEQNDALNLTIGFKKEDGKLVPAEYAPFCYFSTQVSFGLKFIVNAPFILTSTRESLDFSNDESIRTNQTMMDGLSSLLADSLLYLRDLGRARPEHRYLSETIFKILPLSRGFVPQNELNKLNIRRNDDNDYFNGFYSKPLEKFQQEEIIPCSKAEGIYCCKNNAYYASKRSIVDRFGDDDLAPVAMLLGGQEQGAHWVYSQAYDYSNSERGREVNRYIVEIGAKKVDVETVIRAVQGRYIGEKREQSQWLKNFYEWLAEQPDSDKTIGRELALLLDQHRNPKPAFVNNAPNLFLPDGILPELLEQEEISVVDPELHQWKDCVGGLEVAWNIRSWDLDAHAERLIQKLSTTTNLDDREPETVKLMRILANRETITEGTKIKVESALWKSGVLKAKNDEYRPLNELYCDSDKWSDFKEIVQNSGCLFVDIDQYGQQLGTEAFKDVLSRIGIDDKPFLLETDWIPLSNPLIGEHAKYLNSVKIKSSLRSLRYRKIVMPVLDMLMDVQSGEGDSSRIKQREKEIFRILLAIASDDRSLKCVCAINQRKSPTFTGEYFSISDRAWIDWEHPGFAKKTNQEVREEFVSRVLQRLITSKWIVGDDGGTCSPSEVTDADLDPAIRNNPSFGRVREWLGIRIGTNGGTGKSDKPMPACLPLSNELKNGLALLQEAVSDSSSPPPRFRDKPEVLSIKSYLSLNLCIPMYQRPYEWNERNVVELLDDIYEAARRKEKPKYRIGSIILHVEDNVCNIVDGQQRTLTLLLVLCRLMCGGEDRTSTCDGARNPYLRLLSGPDFYPALPQCKTSRRNLRNNLVHIDEYFRMHPDSEDRIRGALEEQLEVVVICVKELSEAFQLFDSQNSKGRPLDPHDLLKAFHLRLIPNEQVWDSRWSSGKTKTEMVKEWEAHDSSEVGQLFETLFRICKWNRKEPCHRFTAQDIGVFKGVPVLAGAIGGKPIPKPYGYVSRAVGSNNRFQIGEPFVPGGDFFTMVEHYFDLYREIRKRVKSMKEVELAKTSCRSKYLEPLFDAVLLDYFDRFGLEDAAEPELAIKKLCKWVFLVRLDMGYLGSKTLNKYALGNGTQSRYSNPIPMFFRIRTAVEPAEVTNIPLKMSSFQGSGVDKYSELRNALEEL